MDQLIAANRRSAADYGWRPADFGAKGFDAGLIARVQAFQAERILDATGFVDRSTFRALQQLTDLVGLVAADQKEHRRQVQFGLGYGNDAEVAPFLGIRMHLQRSQSPRGLAAMPAGAGIVCDVKWASALPLKSPATCFAWVPTRPDLLGQVHAQVQEAVHHGAVGIVLGLPEKVLAEADVDSRPLHNALDALQAVATCPVAVGLRVDPWHATPKPRLAMLAQMKGRFVAAVTFLSGRDFQAAAEPCLGKLFGRTKGQLQIAGACNFPTFLLDNATPPDHIIRARMWLRRMQHRGHAFSWPMPAHLIAAALGDLPDQLTAIDPAPPAEAYHRAPRRPIEDP